MAQSDSGAALETEPACVPPPQPEDADQLSKNILLIMDGMQKQFQAINNTVMQRLDDMAGKIDELEKNVTDAMSQVNTLDNEPEK